MKAVVPDVLSKMSCDVSRQLIEQTQFAVEY